MGICCSNRPTRDDLKDEIRRDARISDYETKENDDLFKSLTSSKSKEKIVFEVKDNPLEDYSKAVFQQLNEIRTNPITFYEESKIEGFSKIIEYLIGRQKHPHLFSWSTKKSRMISDFFQNTKNTFKSTGQKIKEIQEKYESDFEIMTYNSKGVVSNPHRTIWNLIKNYNNEDDIKKLLLDSYIYCVIYSEANMDYSGNLINNNGEEVTSYFFLFKQIVDK